MSRFEKELKNDKFVCSECLKCNKIVWPPSDNCNRCLDLTTWRTVSRLAKLIEYSYKEGECFGVAEFEGQIRVVGTIEGKSRPQIGQTVVLEKCDYDGDPVFIFSLQVHKNDRNDL